VGRPLPAALLIAALLAAAAAWASSAAAPPRLSSEGPVWRLRAGGLLYRFHATFRVETLFDEARDPYETDDLSRARPGDLERLRAVFLRRLHLPGLDQVPVRGREWREMLEGNGYFR